jgi:hypothetical protein
LVIAGKNAKHCAALSNNVAESVRNRATLTAVTPQPFPKVKIAEKA